MVPQNINHSVSEQKRYLRGAAERWPHSVARIRRRMERTELCREGAKRGRRRGMVQNVQRCGGGVHWGQIPETEHKVSEQKDLCPRHDGHGSGEHPEGVLGRSEHHYLEEPDRSRTRLGGEHRADPLAMARFESALRSVSVGVDT